VTVAVTLLPLLELVGTELGAEYRPLEEIVPLLLLPPTRPFTFQVTPVVEVPVTAAVNCCVPSVETVAELGDTETAMPPWTVTLAVPDLELSTWATAVIVTARGVVVAAAGAAYRPAEEIVPYVEFPPVTPPACQVTAVLDEPFTVAVNCCVCPKFKFVVNGETETLTPELSVTGTFAVEVPLAWAMQLTVTVLGVENVFGAVYNPVLEIVPTVELPPTT
jgi:hypothetical protein